MPARFGLTYMGPDNTEHSPSSSFTAHSSVRSSASSASSSEHFGGAFPFWLAPVQVRILPVGEDHRPAAAQIADALRDAGFRVDVDDRDETVGKRIRDAELEKVPKTIVYGDRESPDSLSIRDRGGEQDQKSLVDFVAELATLES